MDSATRLVLVNAVYFKGAWATGFDPSQTSSAPFTLSDGTQVPVPTMNAMVGVARGYPTQGGLDVYELPYKGGTLAMDFLLPTGSLSALESSLTPALLSAAFASLGGVDQGEVSLPKFSFGDRLRLDPLLSSLGMPDVFNPASANLSGIDGAMDLYVSFVVQQALVEVDEQGTVAAAATAGGVTTSSAQVPIELDHPFLFLIRDTKNGSILFMGRVEDPRQS